MVLEAAFTLDAYLVLFNKLSAKFLMFSQSFFFFFILGEIDIFEAFNINVNTKGVTQVQGLAKEFGNAYKIGKSMPRMEQSNHVLDEIKSFLIRERRLVIIVNVKVKHFSFGTLFSVESKSRGIEFIIVLYDLQRLTKHWFNVPCHRRSARE